MSRSSLLKNNFVLSMYSSIYIITSDPKVVASSHFLPFPGVSHNVTLQSLLLALARSLSLFAVLYIAQRPLHGRTTTSHTNIRHLT